MTLNTTAQNDFSKGSIIKNILNLAFPMILAQVINVLYNIIDQIFYWRNCQFRYHVVGSLAGIKR